MQGLAARMSFRRWACHRRHGDQCDAVCVTGVPWEGAWIAKAGRRRCLGRTVAGARGDAELAKIYAQPLPSEDARATSVTPVTQPPSVF